MINLIDALPNGIPIHAVCSQCQQHWRLEIADEDGIVRDLPMFVRIHLRAGNRYVRLMTFPN